MQLDLAQEVVNQQLPLLRRLLALASWDLTVEIKPMGRGVRGTTNLNPAKVAAIVELDNTQIEDAEELTRTLLRCLLAVVCAPAHTQQGFPPEAYAELLNSIEHTVINGLGLKPWMRYRINL